LVREQAARAIVVDGDLADVKVVKQLFDATLQAFDRVDIVINNAGLVIKKPFTDITESDFDPNTRQAPPFRAGKDSADAAGVLRHAQ
jgi:NAD(P)-dependent dehydrogenase (short-subunit alcohol dehydrogenase family)